MEVQAVAGAVSTTLFAIANLPMVVKAIRTKDLRSYSVGYLVLGNVANLIHTVYVVSLPPGPIWALHAFYLLTMGIMLVLLVRHRSRRSGGAPEPRTHEEVRV